MISSSLLEVKAPKKDVSGFFHLRSKVTEQIGNSAKKKLDDRAKMPVSKTVLRNKNLADRFLLLTHRSNHPQNSRTIEHSNVRAAREVFPHWSQKTITPHCLLLFRIVSRLGYRRAAT